MLTIWKFVVPLIDGPQNVSLPLGAEIVFVAQQDGCPVIWAEVDPGAARVTRRFQVIGTGHAVPIGKHVGSVIAGMFVWHVYEVT